VTAQVIAANRDVVSLSLIPYQDLFGALSTFTLVALAPDGRLGGSNRGSGGSTSNHALKTLHVNVRLAAPIRNPNPSTSAAICGTSRHVLGNIVACNTFPRGIIADGKHGEVVHRNLADIRLVRDCESSSSSHRLVLSMHVWVAYATTRRKRGARQIRNRVVLRVVSTITPLGCELTIKRQGRNTAVSGYFDSKGTSCG
jgi:hypothetical protein